MAGKQKQKSSKAGRNMKKCASYRASYRRHKNKVRKLLAHIAAHPKDMLAIRDYDYIQRMRKPPMRRRKPPVKWEPGQPLTPNSVRFKRLFGRLEKTTGRGWAKNPGLTPDAKEAIS